MSAPTSERLDLAVQPLSVTAEGPAAARLPAASAWLADIRADVNSGIEERGAVLLRGLPLQQPQDVAALRTALGLPPARIAEFFSHQPELAPGVYGTARWPSERMLCPRHEQSYSHEFPGLVLLACLRQPEQGGHVLLSDARSILAHLPAGLVQRFRAHGWLMTRVFRDLVGTSWRDAFGVDEVADLEALLDANLIAYAWTDDDALATIRLRSATIHHPRTGEECWFNHAAFLNEWGLDPEEREVMLEAFGPDGLPTNTYIGDGSALTPDEVRTVEAVYEQLSTEIALQAGDLLVLDNIRVAHGNRPYTGQREWVIGTADPVRLADCRPTAEPRAVQMPGQPGR